MTKTRTRHSLARAWLTSKLQTPRKCCRSCYLRTQSSTIDCFMKVVARQAISRSIRRFPRQQSPRTIMVLQVCPGSVKQAPLQPLTVIGWSPETHRSSMIILARVLSVPSIKSAPRRRESFSSRLFGLSSSINFIGGKRKTALQNSQPLVNFSQILNNLRLCSRF